MSAVFNKLVRVNRRRLLKSDMDTQQLAHEGDKGAIRSGEQKIKRGAWLVLVIITILAFVHYFLVDPNPIIFSIPVGYLSFVLVLHTYFWTKRTDRFRFGNEKRHQFICDEKFKDIRSRIEHNDVELQVTIAATNSVNPFDPNLLPTRQVRELHERFDAYLNWIEGFAILWKSGLIEDSELEGLWQYYPRRLSEAMITEQEIRAFLSTEWGYDETAINALFESRKKRNEFPYPSDPLDMDKEITPITRPIWFYVNRKEYVYTALVDLIKSLG